MSTYAIRERHDPKRNTALYVEADSFDNAEAIAREAGVAWPEAEQVIVSIPVPYWFGRMMRKG